MSRRSRALGTYNSYNPKSKQKIRILKLLRVLVSLFIFYQVVTFFIVSSFIVGSSSMEPGILKNQKILSSPIVSGINLPVLNLRIPGIGLPERGDIVIIRPVNRESIPWYITVLDPVVRFFTLQKKTLLSGNNKPWNNQIAVKRIIGLPGDEIKLVNYHFYIKPEGEKEFIPEEQITDKKYEIIFPVKSVYDTSTVPFFGNMEELMLTENNYFVANDNRQMQYDSRLYGPVSRDLIIGEVFLSYFPGFSLK